MPSLLKAKNGLEIHQNKKHGAGSRHPVVVPLGHLPDDEHDLGEQEALEQLAAWSLFARWIERAKIEPAG